ncbi:MAG: exodeoxyribonuclease VII large subunit [Deltaproteobacteria bacterium]|nr:exodeoxyribonuclease VII large subunit [Deltaproteobacteria bacterium]
MVHPWPFRVYTVSELTFEIRRFINSQFKDIFLEGEISNLRIYPSGHAYFSLKDEGAVIKCVMFNFFDRYFGKDLCDGLSVLLRGRVDVYEKRGEYQFLVEEIETKGLGLLTLKFELVKRKLKEEGIFDSKWKKKIPVLPQRIGIITSPLGAAIKDMLRIIKKKFDNMQVLIYPVRVQGREAVYEIIEGLKYFNQARKVDVIIIARGGGSIEDLAPFNEEELARAIFRSEIPVVTGIGHEIDFTIADLVSDLRAPTPTAAADVVVPEKKLLKENLELMAERLKRSIKRIVETERATVHRLFLELKQKKSFFDKQKLYLDDVSFGFLRAMFDYLKTRRNSLSALNQRLNDLNPESILKRGYSITFTKEKGEIVKDADQVTQDEEVYVLLYRGKLLCKVERKLSL